jgi:hypothetical protein
MTEPTAPVTPAAPAQEPNQPPAQSDPPPWGNDFDPARAWHTIQSLREKEKELTKQPRLTSEQQAQLSEYQRLVEASKSEDQRREEAVAAAQREAETARADAIRYKAAATYGVPQEHFDLLGSGTEEEVSARAEKIRTLLAAQTASPPPTTTTVTPSRPVEQLRPGATPSQTDNEDDVIFAALFPPRQ